MSNSDKIPMPKDKNLYLPVDFWSSILASLDMKVETVSKGYGFGQINLTIVLHRGQVSEVYMSDEVRVKGVLEKYQSAVNKHFKSGSHPTVVNDPKT